MEQQYSYWCTQFSVHFKVEETGESKRGEVWRECTSTDGGVYMTWWWAPIFVMHTWVLLADKYYRNFSERLIFPWVAIISHKNKLESVKGDNGPCFSNAPRSDATFLTPNGKSKKLPPVVVTPPLFGCHYLGVVVKPRLNADFFPCYYDKGVGYMCDSVQYGAYQCLLSSQV